MKSGLFRVVVLALLGAGMLSSCAPAATPAPTAVPTMALTSVVSIENASGMPSASMPTAGGMFMVIKNTGTAPDKLLSGSSPACGSIEVHEMVKKADGTMGMNLLDKPLDIPAGGQVELKSGGIHIMCIMKKDDLFKAGSKVDLTLVFEKAGSKTVSAEIKMAVTPTMAPMSAISIENASGKPSMDMPTAGGMFMVIKNTGTTPDKLLSGTSPACGSIEVHEMVMKADGSMGMNLLDKPLDIPAGGQVELKSGGIHIMCIMKKDDLFKEGSKIDLTLVFEKAGSVTVSAEIKMQ